MPKQSLTKGSFCHPWAKGKARKLLCRSGAHCSNPFRFMVKDLCDTEESSWWKVLIFAFIFTGWPLRKASIREMKP